MKAFEKTLKSQKFIFKLMKVLQRDIFILNFHS